MNFNNTLSRYKFYVEKRIKIFFQGLSFSRIKGRLNGPKVVLNSLPKSGTHLIETLFFELPNISHYGGRTIMMNSHDNSIAQGLKKLSKVGKGQFVPAHIQYDDVVYSFFKENQFKVIQMIRDPRDVLISHWLYVKNLDKTHKAHEYISSLENDFEQFKAVVVGKEGIVEPFAAVASKFYGWFDKQDILIVRFEDLVGSKGGGSDTKQFEVVKSIANHIGFLSSDKEMETLTGKIFSTKSSTFNTGTIGKWKKVFKQEHKDLCKNQIQHILELYGYEKDASW